jgi:hypothetical protein
VHLLSGLVSRGRAVPAALAVAGLAVGAGGTAVLLSGSGSGHVVSMPVAGRGSATLEITSGTPVLTITVARLGGTLLRVSTPDSAPVRPVLSGTAPVVLSLVGSGGTGGTGGTAGDHGHSAPYAVSVVLSSAVVWNLDLAAGTQRTSADLRGGRVGAIAVTAGSDILDVTLPRPARTVALRLTGGASQFLISLPGGVPAEVTVGGGASYVTVDGQSRIGVAGGTVLTSTGWSTATSRFDIDAIAGVSRLTVSRW